MKHVHFSEWQRSQVAPEIIAANVRSIEGQEVVERLAGHKLGAMGGWGAQYVTGAVNNVLRRYDNSVLGGWWVSGLDPLNDWAPMEWGQFKADTPDFDGKGKPKKYASSESQRPRALFLGVSWRVALKIAKRHGYGKEYRQRIRAAFADTFQASESSQENGDHRVADRGDTTRNSLQAHQRIEPSEYQSSNDRQQLESNYLFPRARGFGADRSGMRAQNSGFIVRLLSAVKAIDEGFWEWWLSIPDAPVAITEGAKKAGAGLTAGYAAIALVGVNAGYRVKDSLGNPCQPEIVDDVKVIATPGRPVYLAFDQDIKPKARRRVIGALMRFGGLLAAAGCIVRIVEWSAKQGKGLDDLVANHGPDALHHAFGQALTFGEWRLKLALDNALGGLIPSMRVNTRKLTTLDSSVIPDSGIVGFRSGKGTSKTNFMVELVADTPSALALGHRIALMHNLCRRLGVNYRGDLDRVNGEFVDRDGYTLRVGGCVDGTLLAIDPEKFRGCDLILDEVVQVLRHLLTSSTCNKDGARPVLLARFTQLVQAARRVIVADADLDKATLDYLAALRGDGAPVWLLVNDAKVEPWPVTFIESPDASAITARLLGAVAAGQRVLVVTDSKAGSKRLDRLIAAVEAAGLRVLLLNSDTSGGEIEKAVITSPDQHITGYQVVIATPSMATGVSIEVEHFDAVYGLFWGASSTDADMAQALARVRQPIPRIVWCAKQGRNFSKISRDTNPLRLRNLLQQKANATAQLTAASLGALGAEITGYDWCNPHVDLWAKIEADRNRSMLNLRSALKVRLIHEGHCVTIEQLNIDLAAREQMAAVRLQIKTAEAQAIEDAANLSPSEVTALERAESLSPDERLALQKWHLAEFYAIPLDQVNAELVLLDNDGRYRGQIREYESFQSEELAIAADVRSVEKQAAWYYGVCPWDTSTATLRRKVRQQLGLGDWLNSDRVWNSDEDDLAKLEARALAMAPQVKAALNISIKPGMSPQQILGQMLEQMGIKTSKERYRADGKARRRYRLNTEALAQLQEVVSRRAARRAADPPPLVEEEKKGGWISPPLRDASLLNPCPLPVSADVCDLADLIAAARQDGPEALHQLRQTIKPFHPDLWRAALATAA